MDLRVASSSRTVYICTSCPWAGPTRQDAAAHQLAERSNHHTERLHLRLLQRGKGKKLERSWATRWRRVSE